MSNLALSYFYQIRNFKKNMLPVSTAYHDPSWFNNFKGEGYIFKDKRGIINGIKAYPLIPQEFEEPPFNDITLYRKQLDKIDLDKFLKDAEELLEWFSNREKIKDPILVLMVYESPKNPYSERWDLFDYFKTKGIKLNELKYPI